ncbi:hypothetical protein WN51_01418 [Melipona quadrifasciata]|uniref:EF-hand domain-containing protein n=1 Tax=Melipona quadrifasciata TaxID=166423 RepID=A0A0M8ZW32_9HYME|nr:hypothetical protein WN51_01418 [Melipona quadrifasciata]
MSQTADAESEAGSICDEERVRKLFQACDGDGDGFIDRYVIDYESTNCIHNMQHDVFTINTVDTV